MARILFVFFLLQIADLATTLVTLNLGGAEKNPLIQAFMSIGPVEGIIYAKIVVLLFAIGCSISRKRRLLQWANVVFAGIVVWNLVVITALLSKR
jgi:hypothetical protein